MSIKAVGSVLLADVTPPARKLALVVLADALNERTGRLALSMATIAQRVGVTRSQAQRLVHSLIDDRLIHVIANQKGGKPGSVPHYSLNFESIASCIDDTSTGRMDATPTGRTDATPTGRTDATGSSDATGRTDAAEGSHPCGRGAAPVRERGRTHATRTVLNRIESEENQGIQKTRASKSRSPSTTPTLIDPSTLLPEVDPSTLADWASVRKSKRAGALTATAVRGLRREAQKAGLTVQEAVELCCERSWASLNADWDSTKKWASAKRGGDGPNGDHRQASAREEARRLLAFEGKAQAGHIDHD